MAKKSSTELLCPSCKTENPAGSVRCFRCHVQLPREKIAKPTPIQRLLGGTARLVAFLLVLAGFGAVFWVMAGDNFETVVKPLLADPDRLRPDVSLPEPTLDVLAIRILLTGGPTSVEVADGGSTRVDLGHDGHQVRLSAELHEGGVEFQSPVDGTISAQDGGRITLHCPHTVVSGHRENGVISMRQTPCPKSLTLQVAIQAPTVSP